MLQLYERDCRSVMYEDLQTETVSIRYPSLYFCLISKRFRSTYFHTLAFVAFSPPHNYFQISGCDSDFKFLDLGCGAG
jgi:hypothetical protein